jgi:hypothetical protein
MKMRACNKELSLSDLLEDPLVLLLMRRDGVTRSKVEELMANIQIQLRNREWRAANSANGVSEFPIVPANSSQLRPIAWRRNHVD